MLPSESKVVHIIPAEAEHLSLGIVESLITSSSQRYYFIIARTSKDDGFYVSKKALRAGGTLADWKMSYRDLFSKYLYEDYVFSDGILELVLRCVLAGRSPIVLHSDRRLMRLVVLVLAYLDVTWVCWGNGFVLKEGCSIATLLNNAFKHLFMWRLDNIVCLMEPDARYIREIYSRRRVLTIPYAGLRAASDLGIQGKRDPGSVKDVSRILLGNSGRHVKSYLSAIEVLKRYAGKVHITCMLNYGLARNEEYARLQDSGREYFGDNFALDETFHDRDDLGRYINSYDVYVCAVESQTGLGVAGLALNAGLKLYLSGHNYEWFNQLGYRVFKYDELMEEGANNLVHPLSHLEKLHNRRLRDDMRERNLMLRERFLLGLIKRSGYRAVFV